jgi:type IV pilus assembly protein PilZ
MRIKVITRKQYHCPHCKGILSDAYIARNPFPEISCPACGRLMRLPAIQKEDVPAPDERKERRYPVSLKVTYRSFDRFFTEYTANISKGGMFLRTETPHEIGSPIDLLLYVPGLDEPIRINGEVVHRDCFSPNKEDAGIGVKFISVDKKSRKTLLDFVKAQKYPL